MGHIQGDQNGWLAACKWVERVKASLLDHGMAELQKQVCYFLNKKA